MWDYKTATTNLIRNEVSNTDWESLFFGLHVHEMVLVFTDILLCIFSKHITNKIVTCNDEDAPWITPEVKAAIRRNSRVYRKWVQRGRIPTDHGKVRETQNSTNNKQAYT